MSHGFSSGEPAEAPGRSPARRRLLALFGLGAAAMLGACGKKGGLRLPEPASPSSQPSDEEEE